MGIFDALREKQHDKKVAKVISRQIKQLDKETDKVLASADLTPEEVNGHERKYHYKDVTPWIVWQYGGRYGKDCKSAGIKKGDMLDLIEEPTPEEPDNISVYWKNNHIGYMKSNRLRNMIKQWRNNGLPVIARVSHVGGEHKLMFELSFYGSPSKPKK